MDYRHGGPAGPVSAVFVDVENMAFAQSGQPFMVERLMSFVLREAHPTVRRAYADWRKVGLYADAFHEHAFDMMQVAAANGQKNAADLALGVDAVEIVLGDAGIRRVYLVTGDSDFCPLVRSLRRQGREVVIIAWSNALGEILKAHADRVVFYEHIAGLQARTAPAALPAVPAPAGEQSWRLPPLPRRTVIGPVGRPGDEDGGGYDFRIVWLISELGAVEGKPIQEVRSRVLNKFPDADLPMGEEFIDWLEQHPRVRIHGLGDDATVTIEPAGGGEGDDDPEDRLNAAIAAENLIFLGHEMQGRVLDMLHELLANRSDPFTRSEMLQTLRFRLREAMPEHEPDYDALNSVFHIFYRAHAFQRFAAAGVRNAPLLLKPPFRDAGTFRALHDRYLIQLAVRQGLDWTPDEWADVLHGSDQHLPFVTEVLASLGRAQLPPAPEPAEDAAAEGEG
jgi:hypothetical protein